MKHQRLIRYMQLAAMLSQPEAEACLAAYKRGDRYSSEAVNHYGGTTAVVKAAIKARHRLRRYLNQLNKVATTADK